MIRRVPCVTAAVSYASKFSWTFRTQSTISTADNNASTKSELVTSLRQYLGLERSPEPGPPSQLNEARKFAKEERFRFVAVDVEAWEHNQFKITEVGMATLDSGDLVYPPKHVGSWFDCIKASHYIIQENKKLVNRVYVKGCPDKFKFGTSQMVKLREIEPILTAICVGEDVLNKARIFNASLTAEKKKLKKDFEVNRTLEKIQKALGKVKAAKDIRRNVIMVGHGLSNDRIFLNKVGFNDTESHGIIDYVDTQELARQTKLPEGLEKLLHALGAEPRHLHNAGNDAAYTMQAMIMLALYGHELPEPPRTLRWREEAGKKLVPKILEKRALKRALKLERQTEHRVNRKEARMEAKAWNNVVMRMLNIRKDLKRPAKQTSGNASPVLSLASSEESDGAP